MFTHTHGLASHLFPLPFWDAAGGGGAGAADGGTAGTDGGQGTQDGGGTGGTGDQNGSVAFDPEVAFANLEPGTREWLQKMGFDKDPVALAKATYEREQRLGSSIKLPGKDATPEELDAFYVKLGRPASAEGYEFTPPKDLPENVPYDAERANQLKTDLFKLGLTKAQASAIHDMYVSEMTGMFGGAAEQHAEAMRVKAEKATDALEKLWGPIDGDTAKANFELAGRVFTDVPGGHELLTELQEIGLVGPNKEVLSEPLAKVLASVGSALFTEDNVLKGRKDALNNPFAEGKDFNLTQAMAIHKDDPERARSLIAAAGKKPADFGLPE